MNNKERAKRDYANLKAKLAADPEYARQRREQILRRQRTRYQIPEARRRHALACETWRQRKAAGITERKVQTTYNRIELTQFRVAPFEIRFDD
jgi:hypothetical protein